MSTTDNHSYNSQRFPGRDLAQEAQETLELWDPQVRNDRDYPALHLAPAVGRLNDPNGLIFDGKTYHAFYQYSPLHPERLVYWRHATSTDLSRWEDRGTALVPNTLFDSHGCYSGSGIYVDGRYEFFYTGNVKDEEGKRQTYQIRAIAPENFVGSTQHPAEGSSELERELPPLISGPAEGYTAHYRDPHVIYRKGAWWMFIGAQRTDKTGAVVAYTSQDRTSWTFVGELGIKDPVLATSYMFECPSVLRMRDELTGSMQDVLIFSPQGIAPSGEKYHNIYQSGYMVGKLKKSLKFKAITPFTELDAGFEFYAPQSFSGTGEQAVRADESGTNPHIAPVLMAWLGNAEQDDLPSYSHRWVHTMTYPRELHLRDGKLYYAPVTQLDQVLPLEPVEADEKGRIKALKDARVWRLRGTVDVSGRRAKLRIKDAHGVALSIDLAKDFASMDRSGTRYTEGGSLRQRSLDKSTLRSFELLVDGSTTELFVGGEGHTGYAEVFSARTFFNGSKRRVRITGAEIVSLEYARLD